MSKTSEKSSSKPEQEISVLKRLVEWGTDLQLRLRNDSFFRARVELVVFITLLVAVITIIFAGLLEYIKKIILISFTETLLTAINTGSVDTSILSTTNEDVEAATVFVLFSIVVLSTLAGIVASRLTLRPISQALRAQKKFIGSISHELRTPLAVLKTNNEVALLEDNLSPGVREILEENINDINYVTEILNNLMLINRTDTTATHRFENVELQSLIEKVRANLSSLAESKQITLSIPDEKLPIVYGSAVALEQAFFNLVKNAISYTPERGHVSISCQQSTGRSVTIQVIDTGVGIPEKDLPSIFDPFFRSDEVEQRTEGTGLGLAIVFEVVKLHKGKVMVTSHVGKGTTFSIVLPRNPQHSGVADEHVPEDTSIEFDFSSTSSNTTARHL